MLWRLSGFRILLPLLGAGAVRIALRLSLHVGSLLLLDPRLARCGLPWRVLLWLTTWCLSHVGALLLRLGAWLVRHRLSLHVWCWLAAWCLPHVGALLLRLGARLVRHRLPLHVWRWLAAWCLSHIGALLLLFDPRLARAASLLEMLLRYRFAWLIAVIP